MCATAEPSSGQSAVGEMMTVAIPQELEHLLKPINSVKPNPRNTKIHTDYDIKIIANSIKAHGFVNPIVARQDNKQIIIGHGRWLAAQTLQMERVPITLINKSGTDATALGIADNKSSEQSEYDFAVLCEELLELDALNYDPNALGMSLEEIEQMMNWTPEGEAESKGDEGETKTKQLIHCPKCGAAFSKQEGQL